MAICRSWSLQLVWFREFLMVWTICSNIHYYGVVRASVVLLHVPVSHEFFEGSTAAQRPLPLSITLCILWSASISLTNCTHHHEWQIKSFSVAECTGIIENPTITLCMHMVSTIQRTLACSMRIWPISLGTCPASSLVQRIAVKIVINIQNGFPR